MFRRLLIYPVCHLIKNTRLSRNHCNLQTFKSITAQNSIRTTQATRFVRSTVNMSGNIVNYEDVKAATTNKDILIIDVREPSELAETGVIPNSLNIPLGSIQQALQLTPEEFKKQYHHDKPPVNEEIIFSCLSGKRATSAFEMAMKLGFNNSKIYLGSWLDWEKHQH